MSNEEGMEEGMAFAGADAAVDDDSSAMDFGNEVTVEGDLVEPEATHQPEPESESEPDTEESLVEDPETEEEVPTEETPDEEQGAESVEESAEESVEEERKPKPVSKKQMVPHSRLEAKNRKIRALEEQLRQSQQAAPQTASPNTTSAPATDTGLSDDDIIAKRQESYNLVLDGKLEEAARVDNEIDAAMRERIRSETIAEVTSSISKQSEETKLQTVADDLQSNYEFLDETSESFDQTLFDKIIAVRNGYISQGYSLSDALTESANDMLQLHRPDLFAEEQPMASAPVVPSPVSKKPALKKAMDAAARQPARVSGDSTRSQAEAGPDIFSMSDSDFDQLSENQLARLRGDIL